MANKSLYLKKNIGTTDQVIRLIIGSTLIVVPALSKKPSWLIATLAAIGGSQIVESTIAY